MLDFPMLTSAFTSDMNLKELVPVLGVPMEGQVLPRTRKAGGGGAPLSIDGRADKGTP